MQWRESLKTTCFHISTLRLLKGSVIILNIMTKRYVQMKNQQRKKKQALNKDEKREVSKIAKKEQSKGIETKYYVPSYAHNGVGTTALIQHLSAVPQETTSATDQVRSGDQIDLAVFRSKMMFQNADADHNTFRVMILQWNVESPVDRFTVESDIGKIISGYTPSAATSTSVTANLIGRYFWDNLRMKKFTILYDKLHTVTTDNPVRYLDLQFDLYKDRRTKKKISYKAGSADDCTNGLYLVVFSDSIVTPHPPFSHISQLTYKDG